MKKLIKDNILTIKNYEPGLPIEILTRELKLTGDISKLASNENPLGPSPLAVQAIKKSLNDGHLYPDTSCYELREKLASLMDIPKNCLCFGNGTTELIYLIGVAFLDVGDTFIMSESSFIMAKIIAQIMNANLVQIPLKDYRHDLDTIRKEVTRDTKIVYLDNPMNPIGSMTNRQEMARFMDRAPDDVIVVFDEAYYEYANTRDYPDTLQYVREGRNVIVLRTFSKLFGLAGLRIGYCASNQEFIKAIRKVSPPFSVNRLAQTGALSAVRDSDHIRKSKEVNESGKKFLCEFFEKMSIFYIPSETNFVTIDIKTDALEVAEELQNKGVIIRPLTMYGMPTFLRVSIGTQEQNQRFVDAFRPIYKSLK
ncbi:MAG: histidinol-phosphate transaminase [Candidatus Aminicenantes bacterium]|jgi:histidinol-phosphate aminotransferase